MNTESQRDYVDTHDESAIETKPANSGDPIPEPVLPTSEELESARQHRYWLMARRYQEQLSQGFWQLADFSNTVYDTLIIGGEDECRLPVASTSEHRIMVLAMALSARGYNFDYVASIKAIEHNDHGTVVKTEFTAELVITKADRAAEKEHVRFVPPLPEAYEGTTTNNEYVQAWIHAMLDFLVIPDRWQDIQLQADHEDALRDNEHYDYRTQVMDNAVAHGHWTSADVIVEEAKDDPE